MGLMLLALTLLASPQTDALEDALLLWARGLAAPRVRFITAPTNTCTALVLPLLMSATTSGCSAMTSLQILSSDTDTEPFSSPFSWITASQVLPVR